MTEILFARLDELITGLASKAPIGGALTIFKPIGATGYNIFGGLNVGNNTLAPVGPGLASDNFGFGKDSLTALTTGYGNLAFGRDTLESVTTGAFNIAVGNSTLTNLTTSNGNVAIGQSSAYRTTTGTHNTSIGLQSFYNNTTGSFNTYVGRDAGFASTTGDWNTGFGVDSNPGNSTGTRNTAVGGEAGYTDIPTNQNVTGSFNTWVGSQSGPGSATQYSNTIALGYQAKTSASNQAVIGNTSITETILRGNVKSPSITLTGTGGSGFIDLPLQSLGVGAPSSGVRLSSDSSIRFNLTTQNGFSASLDLNSLTAVRVFTLPDATGTFLLLNGPLGTPLSGVATNLTGTAAGLTAGNVTTNANLTGDVTSVGNATTLAAGNAGNLNSGTLLAARMPAFTGDITTTVGTVATVIGATKVTSAMLNADVFSTAHSWAGQQTFVTPILGTPASGVATNLTGTASGLTAGNVTTNANLTGDITSVGNATTLTNAPVIAKVLTGYVSGAGTVAATDSILQAIQKLNGNNATNANLTGPITSVGNATSIASQTGTGTKFVVDTSPTLVTPVLGVATATSINGVIIDNAAWSTYSPTVVSETVGATPATYTVNSARYKQLGKTTTVAVVVSVTNQGVGAGGSIIIGLPFTASSAANARWVGTSTEYAATGLVGQVNINSAGTTMATRDATNSTYIVTSRAIVVEIAYETA